MDFIIREASQNDYMPINNLVMEIHHFHLENRPDVYVNIENPLMQVQFEQLLKAQDIKLFVAEDSNGVEIVAYCIIRMMKTQNVPIIVPKTFAFIDDFCVKSSHKKNGIGRLLFNHASSYAKQQGASSIELNVWEFNNDALGFYEAMGMATRNRRMELFLK